MRHEVHTGAATVTAWCALDPFLIAPLLNTTETIVRSTDPLTGEAITLTITPNGVRDVSPPTVVVSMLEPDGPFQADVVQRFCHCVPFFASPESGRQWTRDHPDTFLLTIEGTNAVALDSWPVQIQPPSPNSRLRTSEAKLPIWTEHCLAQRG